MFSNNPAIIGIDIEIIITFPPISTLLAIAVSPESLQMLTANSVNIAIPVIFINKARNSWWIEIFPARLFNKSIIPEIFEKVKARISAPAMSET